MKQNEENDKYVICYKCDEREVKISKEAVRGICWVCCQKMVEPPKQKKPVAAPKIKRPRGWKFMKEFVDVEGNVFFKGVEQPKLKGTLPATEIKTKSKFERNQEKLKRELNVANRYAKRRKKK